MAIDFTQFEATIQTKLDAVTDEKEMLLLGKAIESTIDNITLSDLQNEGSTQVTNITSEGTTQVTNVTTEGDTQVTRVIDEGDTQVARITSEGGGFVASDGTYVGTMSGDDLILSGNLTVNGTATTLNTSTLDVEDANIRVSKGAVDSASANGAGLTVDGAGATLTYAATTDSWDFNKDIRTPNKVYFANRFDTETDLPSPATYHGMFAHVHGTGEFYGSHAGGWYQLVKKNLDGSTTLSSLNVNGAIAVDAELIATSYNETVGTITSSDVDLSTGNVFEETISANTTYTFSNPPSSGTAFGFTLKVTASGGAYTITWPGSVEWAGGTAPDAPADGETDVYAFFTTDGGTTYYGFQAGDALS